MSILPRTVVVLGCVSLLNDAASEMLTPLLPIFITSVLGAGPAVVGLIEGLAETTASVLKLYAGRLADRGVNPKALVIAGYGASNAARPLIGLALSWPWVLALRFCDRVGKGLRTAPRDALIAGAVDDASRGRAFGFHRSMDHAGAVIGPLIAYWLLSSNVSLPHVFLWSMVPGMGVLLLLAVGVPKRAPTAGPTVFARLQWRTLDARLRAMIIAAAGLAFAAVPEVFVLLWAKDAGLDIAWAPLLWAAASLVKMMTAMPAGALSDRIGRIPVLMIGLAGRIAALSAIAWTQPGKLGVWCLFIGYAMSLAIAEPAERAIIGDHAAVEQRGSAFGLYHLGSGLFALPGALMFGVIWQQATASAAFFTAAILTALSMIGLLWLARDSR